MSIYERRNSLLGMELDRYIREHPEFSERIPDNAHIVMLLEGDKEFNEWSAKLGDRQAEKDQPIVYITIKKLAPIHSRITELDLVTC